MLSGLAMYRVYTRAGTIAKPTHMDLKGLNVSFLIYIGGTPCPELLSLFPLVGNNLLTIPLLQTDKSFPTRKDAEAFVAGKNPSDPDAPAKYYGLAVGDKPGVYTDWSECQNNMLHTKGPKFRKFSTAQEAKEFVKDWKKFVAKEKSAALAVDDDEDDDEYGDLDVIEDGPSMKKVKVEASKVGEKGKSGKPEKVYTDGSSLGNGKAGSTAGVGVYFGPDDSRFVPPPPPPPPNQTLNHNTD